MLKLGIGLSIFPYTLLRLNLVYNEGKMDMIEETSKKQHNLYGEIEEEPLQGVTSEIKDFEVKGTEDNFSSIEPPVSKGKVNRLFIELLICSLLLWSLLFIKQSPYENQVTQIIKQVLEQNIQSELVQEFVEELETAVKQIL